LGGREDIAIKSPAIGNESGRREGENSQQKKKKTCRLCFPMEKKNRCFRRVLHRKEKECRDQRKPNLDEKAARGRGKMMRRESCWGKRFFPKKEKDSPLPLGGREGEGSQLREEGDARSTV